MPFFHPAGLNIWKSLMSFWYEKHREAGYEEIKTPLMMTRDLWETSGHWANYRENMYTTSIDEHDYAIKPMNCPGCMLFFKSGQYSYRRLPLRVAEVGNVHRHELSGALSGLFRYADIESEIIGILNLSKEIYGAFGLSYAVELSTRPAKSIGTDAQWEIATNGLLNALKNNNIEYKLNEGDGAFYGPKIDLHIKDAIGRTWQCGTIQLDMMFPEKFDLTYDDEDGQKKRPVMLHRTILGSIERFLGILIEHYAGRFPLWISPRQAAVVSVSDRNSLYAEEIVRELQNAGFKAESDTGADSMGKKIRNAQTMQYNYMITVGDRECEEKKLALRTRNGKIVEGLPLTEIISALNSEVSSRSDTSAFDK
ncbi:hypothetical protein CHS0354_035219 [Potamilus streckersoni]|uniref:threonine--tRNA ligase n=1 Tax=Potamilus streckersoni TaxID=2493646 RepID=A0AAE0S2T9_9BIVA|nr:hypothetical protein CHS0354_035219 [Potamilus streckersoni]